jgi:hypothetical protein
LGLAGDKDLVLATTFGPIVRSIRGSNERIAGIPVPREACNTDADRHLFINLRIHVPPIELLDCLSNSLRFGLATIKGGLRENHAKLVTAVTRREIRGAQSLVTTLETRTDRQYGEAPCCLWHGQNGR